MLTSKQIPSIEEIAEILRSLSEEALDTVLAQIEHTPHPIKASAVVVHAKVCPRCGSTHIRRNGTVRHKQRYSCCNCHRSFGDTTGTLRFKSKHTKETWDYYLESFAMKLTLREAAQRCNISLTTAFYWRHKILDALASDLYAQVLTGVIQADETYVQDNYKGNYQAAKNLGKAIVGDVVPAYQLNRVSGHRHGRGKATGTRGLSKQKICIPCAIDAQGKTLARAAGKGMVQQQYLDYALDKHLTGSSVLVTDKSQANLLFCEAHEFPLVQLKAGSESHKSKPYNLQKINNLHSRFKRLIALFKGVGSKYLNNYLAWNGFDMNHIGMNKVDIKDKLVAAMNSIGEFSTYKEVFGKPALPFSVSE